MQVDRAQWPGEGIISPVRKALPLSSQTPSSHSRLGQQWGYCLELSAGVIEQ